METYALTNPCFEIKALKLWLYQRKIDITGHLQKPKNLKSQVTVNVFMIATNIFGQ